MNRSSCVIEDGVGNSAIALTFVGRGRMPLLSTRWPRKSMSDTPKRHVFFQTIEQNPKVFFVFSGGLAGNQYVIQVIKNKI